MAPAAPVEWQAKQDFWYNASVGSASAPTVKLSKIAANSIFIG
jgi:hypothetical protein